MKHVAEFDNPVAFDTFLRWARLLGLHFAYKPQPQGHGYIATARPRFVWPCRVVAQLARLHVWQRHLRRKMMLGKIAIVTLVIVGAWIGPAWTLAATDASGTVPDAAEEPYWFNGRVCDVPDATHSCIGYTATPLAGVTVVVWNDADGGTSVPVDVGVTDADGEFRLAGTFPANGRMMAGAYLPGGFRRVALGWPTWPAFYYDFRYVAEVEGAATQMRVFLPVLATGANDMAAMPWQ